MKKVILVAALLVAVNSAFAQSTNVTTGSNSTALAEGGAANNAGNTQQIIFEGGGDSTQTQIISGGTTNTNTNITELSGETTENIEYRGGYVVRQEFGTQRIKNTPSVSGPPLTTSNDTCMGSSSGSVNAPGIGIGLGTTWTDENCKMLKNARELWNMGMRAASMALMCNDEKNREALEITGFVCPQTERAQAQAAQRAANAGQGSNAQMGGEQYTDPLIRRRLGLPPL